MFLKLWSHCHMMYVHHNILCWMNSQANSALGGHLALNVWYDLKQMSNILSSDPTSHKILLMITKAFVMLLIFLPTIFNTWYLFLRYVTVASISGTLCKLIKNLNVEVWEKWNYSFVYFNNTELFWKIPDSKILPK